MSAGRKLKLDEALSGYILFKISRYERALTTTLVKDEVLIWLSRHRASALAKFLNSVRMMPNLEIVVPTMEDEKFAVENFGKYSLGISDLINLGVMKRLRVNEIYTTDKGFENVGVKVVFSELKSESEFEEFLLELKRRGYEVKT
ncbi:MAG: PIN domain-containing protein [Candidatus Baldrarchaeia archaeon]